MRISDWSSDVCSSDLLVLEKPVEREDLPEEIATDEDILPSEIDASVPAAPAAGVQSFTVQYSSPDVDSVTATERSEEHTSELQSLMRISYAVFCLKKKHKDISEPNTHYPHATSPLPL